MNCVPGLNGDLRVPERDPLEVRVVGGADVEQREVTSAIEDDRPVTGCLDRDRHVLGAIGGEVVGPIERHGPIHLGVVGVLEAIVLIDAGVHEDGVSGLTRGRPDVAQSVPAHQKLYAHMRPSNAGSIF
jgi:hypothetical protein